MNINSKNTINYTLVAEEQDGNQPVQDEKQPVQSAQHNSLAIDILKAYGIAIIIAIIIFVLVWNFIIMPIVERIFP